MDNRDRINNVVLLVLVLSVSLVFLYMIRQYLMALFMAGLFSALLSPAYRALCRRLGGREVIASLIIIVAVFALFLVPLSILIGIVAGQAVSVSQSVTPWIQGFIDRPSELNQYLEKIPFYEYLVPYRAAIIEKLGQAVGNISTFLINSLSSVTKMTLNALIGIVLMFYSMFFLLMSGEKFLRKILYFLPLRDKDEQLLLHRFTSVTVATLKGTLIIGIVQGTICGTAFALVGIEGAVFWGAVMSVLSFIPVFGISLAWGPAMIILILQGSYWEAILLLLICGGIAGNIDNVLRPRLVGKDTQIHDLVVLFSTLGGISMFGILGIIVGPIIAALCITLWELYGKAFQDYLPVVGSLRPMEEPEAPDAPDNDSVEMVEDTDEDEDEDNELDQEKERLAVTNALLQENKKEEEKEENNKAVQTNS